MLGVLLCESVGAPVKHEKTVQPTMCASLHGVEVDTVQQVVRLPQDKVAELRHKLQSAANRKSLTLRELQSLLGSLNFACRAIVPGRVFLRRLVDLTRGVLRPDTRVRLDVEARKDIRAWLFFLDSYNGATVFLLRQWSPSEAIQLVSDASGFGYGVVFGRRWIQGLFPPSWRDVHISCKEILPIMLAVRCWGPLLANSRVLFHCDNTAVVAVINAQSSRDSTLMALLRKFVVACMIHNVQFHAQHIPGKKNLLADFVSRFQIAEARAIHPQLNPEPERVEQDWLPW